MIMITSVALAVVLIVVNVVMFFRLRWELRAVKQRLAAAEVVAHGTGAVLFRGRADQ